jgi:menaquinone-9 beta-reductase
METPKTYDVAVAGGGLGGLSAAILLAKKGYSVVLFEKENYPFHKVCGEYVSLESWDLVLSLGLPLEQWLLPLVDHVSVTSPDGTELYQRLPLGGFGISRYKIDHELCKVASKSGVEMYDGTRVHDMLFNGDMFKVSTEKGEFLSRVCLAATGKRSNLDVKWKRPFVLRHPNALNNYIGVKYHALLEHPRNVIALHNFEDGYCGIAPIEDSKVCICYLTTASNLRKSGNDLKVLEEKVLFRNVFLKEAFENATMLHEKPVTISQVSFEKKEQVRNHVLMIGDAAGMIAPLCGNGMSMALFSSKIVCQLIDLYLEHRIDRQTLERKYAAEWNRTFARRLRAGRIIQSLFGKEWVTNKTVGLLKRFPRLVNYIIRQTHGDQRSE